MLEGNLSKYKLTGTKAETLYELAKLDYNVPKVYYFNVQEWNTNSEVIITTIIDLYKTQNLAVRSSAKAEDTADSSMAGAFESLLNVEPNPLDITKAIHEVIDSFDDDIENQILIQPMVTNVAMSGVIMSKVLDDGSPYHVINYDDSTGLTDTVTSGSGINKTVYIYNGVNEGDFDSPFLLAVLKLVRDLESTFPNTPLDIEFAINKKLEVFLLQVRKITTVGKWNKKVIAQVSDRIEFLKQYVGTVMEPRPNLYGSKTLLGFMPDWNPAEMIGVVPHPLSMSLYRELITRSTWRIAREKMGYRLMPNVDLMVSLFGRAYIDVRASINSFIPEGLESGTAEKVVNAYIERLDKNPHFHDKLEFEVVHTAYDFDFDENFSSRYPNLLEPEEFYRYRSLLRDITRKAISNEFGNSLNLALRDIEKLKSIQSVSESENFKKNSFSISDRINSLMGECIEYGTLPFSIIARHGFIAEGLLRSAVSNNVFTEERIKEFRRSIVTVAGEMSGDFQKVLSSKMTKEKFLEVYGHLRPNSYDIMSPNYSNRKDLFKGSSKLVTESSTEFRLTDAERSRLNLLLGEHGIDGVSAEDIINYADKAIKGREYAKFIFTKHLSAILEYIAEWGEIKGFSREELSMLKINDILSILFAPFTNDVLTFYKDRIKKAENNFDVASSFKLSYLIRSVRDVHIVPMQRSAPNFIGNKLLEGEIVELTPYMENVPNLEGKIICIEGADPGYDWIFTRNIAGLITKYGGANSHMAIRSAEYNIPAAIGCGEQPYQRVVKATSCILDCQGKRLEPLSLS